MAILHDPLYVFRAFFPKLTARQRYGYLLIACWQLDREAARVRLDAPQTRLLEDRG